MEARSHPTSVALPVSDEARLALKAFWTFLQPIKARVNDAIGRAALAHPTLSDVLRRTPPERLAADQAATDRAQERALVHGDWTPLVDLLTQQGQRYAELGLQFGRWFELVALFREQIRTNVFLLARTDLEAAQRVSDGLNAYIDVSLAILAEAYLAAKERTIGRQQEAIRELSTPVLQVRDRLLIIPIIGMVDTLRARQLTEALLRGIRERRARAVVMDVTGVPIVDSRVANHLVQACEAARLMGAHVFMTGISSAIAQALVTLGAELHGIPTLGDLQTGLEAAEAVLRELTPAPLAAQELSAAATPGKA